MPKIDPLSPGFATIKRLVAMVVGALVIVLNKKLGLGLDTEDTGLLILLIMGYMGQSAYKEAAMEKGKAAAAKVDSVATAIEELKKGGSIDVHVGGTSPITKIGPNP